ncbi:MAG: GatB/YqeY domain-containing protein [Gordonia sp. (in: high G+C Gram-positive bacteria)]|uniref:hypothetical protein n=1 Tax=Gordonia sp. (in: high G+C Gram-positive bacteria) TaxID=84139 RepID=UPI0039E31138
MTSPDEVRTAMRADLRTAMKAKDKSTVSALRTALAAIDNAESVDAGESATTSAHVAGASLGAGSAEADRKQLSADDVAGILRTQVLDLQQQAEQYEALGRDDAAAELRAQAAVIARY